MSPARALKILTSNLALEVSEKNQKKILKCPAFRAISKSVDYKSREYLGSMRQWAILEDIIRFNIA